MKLTFNSRPVEVDSISFDSDVVDCYIERAFYLDTEIELTDEECQQLTDENPEFMYEEWNEYQIGRAEAYADAYKDGTYD
jgi:hypothetical protein